MKINSYMVMEIVVSFVIASHLRWGNTKQSRLYYPFEKHLAISDGGIDGDYFVTSLAGFGARTHRNILLEDMVLRRCFTNIYFTTLVPAFPAIASSISSGVVMMTEAFLFLLASTNSAAASIFGRMLPALKWSSAR